MHPSSEFDAAVPSAAAEQIEMPRYVSHKTVWALEISKIDGHTLSFAEKGYAPMAMPDEMFSRYTPVPGDYYVVYADGYKSLSPRKAFTEGYARVGVISGGGSMALKHAEGRLNEALNAAKQAR